MNLKIIGYAGELKVIAKLLEEGWTVFREVADSCSIDLIAIKGKILNKIQVKHARTIGKKLKRYSFRFSHYKGLDWDFLICVVPEGIYILPQEFIRGKYKKSIFISPKTKKLKVFLNNWKLLEMNKKDLLIFLIDHKLHVD